MDIDITLLLLLGGELLTERCRTDDLLPSTSLSLAFLHAVWTPKFRGWTSSSIVLSEVARGRPTGLL